MMPDMHLRPGIQKTPESLYMVIGAYSANNTTTPKKCPLQ